MKKLFYVVLACTLLAATAFAADQLTIKCSDVKSAKGALETDSYAINNSNVIAGDYVDSAGVQHGMLVKGKVLTTFDGPPGSTSIAAYGVNSSQTAVGWYLNSAGVANGFSFSKGTMTPVNYPKAASTEANGINDSGQIVGSFVDTAGNTHGFYFDGKAYHQIDVAGALSTVAWAINASKTITLEALNSSSLYDSYLYDGTNFTLVDVPGAAQSVIHGINSKGDLDYTIFDSSNNRHGVLFKKSTGVFTQFDDPKGVNTTRADGINDKDTMDGRYTNASGNPPSTGFKCTAK